MVFVSLRQEGAHGEHQERRDPIRIQQPKDEEIRVFGTTAVVTGRVVLKVIYSGKESSGPYRFINVWVKMQGRWQIVANQITPIAQ